MFQQYKQKQLQINKIIYLYKQKKVATQKNLTTYLNIINCKKREKKQTPTSSHAHIFTICGNICKYMCSYKTKIIHVNKMLQV